MGIYIENMEMPTSCISCPLNFGEKRPEYGLTIYCPYSDGVISWRDKAFDNGRLASCGIVPVPPHGRFGNLDEFINIKYELPNGQKAFNRGFHSGVQYVQRLIMDAPTIIKEES